MFNRSKSFSTNFNHKDIVGKVKALLIGIEYRNTGYELIGCIKDILDVKRQILSDYPQANITLLTDDTPLKPTRDNILKQLKELVASSSSGDVLFFHYSGHGSQVPDPTGIEKDGMNETICPINFIEKRTEVINGVTRYKDSQIIDDEIHAIISTIPKGVKFLMVFDSCHSGTIGDLKYDFATYHGPNDWQDDNLSSEQLITPSPTIVTDPTSNQTSTTDPTSSPEPSIPAGNLVINCNASWTYVAILRQLWITPMDYQLYKELVGNKFIVPASSNVPMQLLYNPNKIMIFNSNFKKLSKEQYEVSCARLGINNLIVHSSVITTPRAYYSSEQISRDYDPTTGKHYHVHRGFGKKRTFSLRSVANCNGGELRIIAGCEESQTSAGTAQYGGACTNAVLATIKSLQGLSKFFTKIFSHNLLELKSIEDSINNYLSKFGYTQHSVISWEHATGGTRALLPGWGSYANNVEFNPMFLSDANKPEKAVQEPEQTLIKYRYFPEYF